jgi:hypothetical protein
MAGGAGHPDVGAKNCARTPLRICVSCRGAIFCARMRSAPTASVRSDTYPSTQWLLFLVPEGTIS